MFNIGDRIRFIDDYYPERKGGVYTVIHNDDETFSYFDDAAMTVEIDYVHDNPEEWEHTPKQRVEVNDNKISVYSDDVLRVRMDLPTEELGVYRPNLEDRKTGKVRVELVDDGFPLALREIAKVMTWAQTAKGYKDHDWQNLPEPEKGLTGATARHRSDFARQRYFENRLALDCTDHESNIIHKAHEAFGVLAQLELMLRGVIK